jgi:YHS domain-containing protein
MAMSSARTRQAVATDLVNVAGASGIALGGYDPVAFFTDGRPVHGDPGITASYRGATYLLASKQHKAAFESDPEKYVPGFGGHCAFGVAVGHLFPVDINTWQIRDGKLYLNLNPAIAEQFYADFEAMLAAAEKNWPELVEEKMK